MAQQMERIEGFDGKTVREVHARRVTKNGGNWKDVVLVIFTDGTVLEVTPEGKETYNRESKMLVEDVAVNIAAKHI